MKGHERSGESTPVAEHPPSSRPCRSRILSVWYPGGGGSFQMVNVNYAGVGFALHETPHRNFTRSPDCEDTRPGQLPARYVRI